MKKLFLMCFVVLLTGCATHAQIKTPEVSQVNNSSFNNKSMSYEIMYSQPKPGAFSGGEQMPLVPFRQAEFSVSSASTLKRLPSLLIEQFPSSVTKAPVGKGDLKLIVELTARDKKGPVFADFEFGKSLLKNLFTLGLASSEYDIIADFDVNYRLFSGDDEIFSKLYKINENVDHEKGDFESISSLDKYVVKLLEKHVILTLNNFFNESSKKI